MDLRTSPRLVCVALAVAMSASSVAAADVATPDSDLPVYVSAKFKKVAKRAFRQLASQELAKACSGHPLCEPFVNSVTDALDAALDGNQAELQASLSALFVDTTVNAVLSFAVEELTTGKLTKTEQKVVGALVACMSQIVTDRRIDGRCVEKEANELLAYLGVPTEALATAKRVTDAIRSGKAIAAADRDFIAGTLGDPAQHPDARLFVDCIGTVTSKEGRKACVDGILRAIADRLVGSEIAKTPAKQELVKRVVESIRRGRAPAAADVVELVALIANHLQRHDVATYLGAIQRVVDKGFEAGLFPMVHASLRDDELYDVVTILPDGGHVILEATPEDDKAYQDAIVAARSKAGSDSKRYDAWLDAHRAWVATRPAVKADLRRAIVMRDAIDISKLAAVLARARDVIVPTSLDDANRAVLRDTNRFAAMLLGVVRLQNFLNRYGAALLAAAAIIDYARTGSEQDLSVAARRVAVFAAGQLALRVRAKDELANAPTTAVHRRLTDADDVCEVQELSDLLELPAEARAADCYGVIAGARRARETVPAEPTERARFAATRIRELVAKVAGTDPIAEARDAASAAGIPIDEIERAFRFLASGDVDAGRKTIARIGVSLIMERIDQVVKTLVKVDTGECESDTGDTSIFHSLGLRCAVYILVQGAYDPVADYLWGVGGEDSPAIAERIYKNLLESKALDSTPLVLNVGLGFNQIWLQGDRDSFSALTVVDKIGVALYKCFSREHVFELGLFAGGFLDALIRTAAEEGEDKRYWLAGVNVGWTRINGMDFGFELHAAAAMPFELDRDEIGFTLGAAVVVPFDLVFDGED
jgi:hypothetical protein